MTKYVCAQCGAPGIVDEGYTLIDERYATGRCAAGHIGHQYLIAEGFFPTGKKKRRKKASPPSAPSR